MAAYEYSKSTLQDNWFEDRLEPEEATGERYLRPVEHSIANVSNDRFDTLSRIARVDKKASYAVPLDGVPSVKTSVGRDDFCDPKSRNEVVKVPPKPSFLTQRAVDEVCKSKGPSTEYDPILHHRGPFNGQRHWDTTTRTNFPAGEQQPPPDMERPAGVESKIDQGPAVVRLCGEKFREGDPADDTRTQRAWLYTTDPTLDREGQPLEPRPAEDNELSLPIGDGAQMKVQQRIGEQLKSGGKMYLKSSDITRPL